MSLSSQRTISPIKYTSCHTSRLAQRGADDEGPGKALSPTTDIAPLVFTDKGAYASPCSLLLVAKPGTARHEFIELTGPERNQSAPSCEEIMSLIRFRRLNCDYDAVDYLASETREDVCRQFSYLVHDGGQGYTTDTSLHGDGEADPVRMGAPSRPEQGVRDARIAALKKTFPKGSYRNATSFPTGCCHSLSSGTVNRSSTM